MSTVEKEQLKDLARNIVRSQTNRYIKNLLRDNGVTIGATKEDFDRNLEAAIDDGTLTARHFEEWLQATEGWGDQHVYVYRLTAKQAAGFDSEAKAKQTVTAAKLQRHWQKPTTNSKNAGFPEDDERLELVSITYGDSLRIHWHNGTTYWIRTRAEAPMDKPNEFIGGFEYQFRAFLGRTTREVMRFEIRPAERLAALFIPKPINSSAHVAAVATADATIKKLLADFSTTDTKHRLKTGDVIRNLDQALSLDRSGGEPEIESQSTRLQDDLAYVEFAARTSEGSYRSSAAVKNVRESIRTDDQIGDFAGVAGTFRFVRPKDLGRVGVFGEGRLRLWKSLEEQDVWHIIRQLVAHEKGA